MEAGTVLRDQLAGFAVGDTWTRLVQSGPAQANEAVVFLHGNPGSAEDWLGLVTEIGGLRRTIAFDLPDFGQSVAAPGFGHTVPEYADFLDQAFEVLGIERVHLVMHDFGGPIGLAWAIRNLNRVAGVTLIDTGILSGYRWHRVARIWQTPGLGELAQAVTTRATFRRAITKPEPRSLPRDFVDSMYDNFDRRTRRAVLDLYRDAKQIGDSAGRAIPVFAEADLPALVIWGAHDSYLPTAFAERQREPFPSASIHVLPDSGHWPFIDDPPAVSRLLTDFLRVTE
ncbi:MAG: alpha/beta hydrolase [Actinomycetota bacterium]|nr:alpha/beta hydrolase [Actinomycetota bacterium]